MENLIKVCFKCKKQKDINLFVKRKNSSTGYGSYCLDCHNLKSRLYKSKNPEKVRTAALKYCNSEKGKNKKHEWVQENREWSLSYGKKRREENKEQLIEYYREDREKNRDKINKQKYEWQKNNPDKRKRSILITREKVKNNPVKLFAKRVRRNISMAFKCSTKPKKTEELLGCSIEEFRQYITSQFEQGMSMENHGRGKDKWHLDHKVPLDSANSIDELIKLNHYTNYQPLWEEDNLRKSNKIIYI